MATVVTRFVAGELTELTIQIPPLRERSSNVVFLAELFILMSMPMTRRARPTRLSDRAKAALTAYSWPGHAQELRGVIERALSLASGDVIDLEHLPSEIANAISAPAATNEAHVDAGAKPKSLREEIEALEKRRILEALQLHPTQRDAAAALDIPMSTFLSRLDAFGIPRVRGGGKQKRAAA